MQNDDLSAKGKTITPIEFQVLAPALPSLSLLILLWINLVAYLCQVLNEC